MISFKEEFTVSIEWNFQNVRLIIMSPISDLMGMKVSKGLIPCQSK